MKQRDRIGIVVGPKGRGTNMRAILAACDQGQLSASVEVVVTPIASNPAAEFATHHGTPVSVVVPGSDYGDALDQALGNCTIICLAGFLRLLPEEVLRSHQGRVLNIHPALLPKFGGQGMYGMRVHEAVVASGQTESGCTVHLVTQEYDQGEILVQKKCPVLEGDTAEVLAARVLELEKLAYPEAIQKLIGRN